jgi:hypothetical protein
VQAKTISGNERTGLPQGDDQILFQDDFSDPNSGWYVGDGIGYDNGEYVITLTEDATYLFGGIALTSPDISIEVDATLVQEEAERQVGIYCRLQENGDRYEFYLSNAGSVILGKVVDEVYSPLTNWIDIPAVYQSGINHLQTVCVGSSLQFYVNEQLVAAVEDESFAQGFVALAAGAYDVFPYSAHFDNVMITSADAAAYPTPAPITSNVLLPYEDDFSDPNSGWDVLSADYGSTGYGNGDYVMTVTGTSGNMYAPLYTNGTDYTVAVDVTQAAGSTPDFTYGLACRLQADYSTGYYLLISEQSEAVIFKFDGELTLLTDWTPLSAPLTGTVHLQAICQGSTLQLYINNELVLEATDSTYAAGDISLFVSTFTAESAEVHFDNFAASLPEGATTALFADDFSDPTSGWEVGSYEGGSVGYAEGAYAVSSTSQGNFMWGIANQNFSDVDLEVDATQISAPVNNNNGYGVYCRLQPNSSEGYLLRISGDGYAAIHISANGTVTPLVDWTATPAVIQGSATNHIRAVCSGSTLQLYANGQLVAEATDSTFASGDISFTATSFEVDPTEIHFDNLVVTAP